MGAGLCNVSEDEINLMKAGEMGILEIAYIESRSRPIIFRKQTKLVIVSCWPSSLIIPLKRTYLKGTGGGGEAVDGNCVRSI